MPALLFHGPVEGWVVNYTHPIFWRVEATMQWGDVLQEAYLVYARCCERYPDAEAKHLMSLFKTAWANHFTDLAAKDSRHRTTMEADNLASIRDRVGDTENEGQLRVLLRQAPSEVRMVLNLFLNAPQEIVEALTAQPPAKRGRKSKADLASSNDRINRALGLPLGTDVLKLVRTYLC